MQGIKNDWKFMPDIFMSFEDFRNFAKRAFHDDLQNAHVFITLSTFKRHARCMDMLLHRERSA